jgi:hypothetical protein
LHANRIDLVFLKQAPGSRVTVEAGNEDMAFLTGLLMLARLLRSRRDGRQQQVRGGEDVGIGLQRIRDPRNGLLLIPLARSASNNFEPITLTDIASLFAASG